MEISRDEYADLLRSAENLSILTRVIYESATLSFIDDDKLVFKRGKADDVLEALRFIDDHRYKLNVEMRRKDGVN
jgi:hypothetical protein